MNTIEAKAISLIKMDFDLITDAIRRLKEGTYCLDNQDEVASARHLLNQTRTALESHIDIEERVFEASSKTPDIADLPEKFFSNMKAEHQHLRNILFEVTRELEESHSIAFQATLDVFSATLNRHTDLELSTPFLDVLKSVSPSTLLDLEMRVSAGYVD